MIVDGQNAWEGGVDSSRSPTLIADNQTAWAVNTTFRGGYAKPRPGINKVKLGTMSDSIQELLSTGYFQGSGIYEGSGCAVSLIASISGHLIKFDLSHSNSVTDITIAGDPGAPYLPKVYFQQAEKYLVIQDQGNLPVIYDGVSTRRSDPANKEVPTGGPMAYGKGRLWVAIGKSYVGGDLVGADGTPDSVIRFTENTFLNEGGSFYIPSQQGDCSSITAMAFGSNIDTSLGEGDLLVFTANSIFAFQAPIDRTVWKNLSYPIQRFALLDYGSLSHDSVVTVNGDLFFRAQDGIRSFVYARRDFIERWGNTPVSGEVNRALDYDDETLLISSSAVNFDNRLLMTVGPTRHDRGTVHRALVALDFDLITNMREKLPPAWEGVWTGVKILQIHRFRLNGEQVCYFFGVDDAGHIGLWQLTKSAIFDNSITPIEWSFETKCYSFGSSFARKRLLHNEIWIDSVVGEVDIQTRFRADEKSCWTPWHHSTECGDKGSCDSDADYCGIRMVKPGVKNRVTSTMATNECGADGPVAVGYDHQLRLEFKGAARLKRLRLSADIVPEGIVGKVSCS